MNWVSFLNSVRPIFLAAYGVFVAWTVVKWAMDFRSSDRKLRDWLGASGIAVGVCSAILFALFYVHIWAVGTLIAHGAALWVYCYTGICFAIAGLILGITGRGWVRQASTIISLVMAFQWSGQMVISARQDSFITIAMFITIGAVGILFIAGRYSHRGDERAHV